MKVIQWELALVMTGILASSACWLDRSIVDLPTVQDAGPPPSSAPGGCQWVASTASGCAPTSVRCDQLAACPPSWMQANSPGSCPQAGTSVRTETCDGMYRWSLLSGGPGFAPGDGYLDVVCYYDMSTGLLAGIDSQSQLPCGTNSYQFGTIPQWCHDDAGVTVQTFACATAGSGGATDGGYSKPCADAGECNGGG